MEGIRLRAPRPDECEELSQLCLRSKAHWGYSDAFLESCRAELAVTPETMNAGYAAVATHGDMAVGYCELVREGSDLIVEKLFVEPECIGAGAGRALFTAMLEHASASSAGRILIDSDPDAEEFYLAMGARRIGEVPSFSIPGRSLPQLEIRLPVERSE